MRIIQRAVAEPKQTIVTGNLRLHSLPRAGWSEADHGVVNTKLAHHSSGVRGVRATFEGDPAVFLLAPCKFGERIFAAQPGAQGEDPPAINF
jgi:hypothetical protein